tara:strand:+ start:156 stop:284 length:129 start_codon:yes stop_codon:yes gene_type:complete
MAILSNANKKGTPHATDNRVPSISIGECVLEFRVAEDANNCD